jgi:hypothetical protein
MTVKETWKPVTIGGVTGILMGAGAMYGVQAMASGSDEVAAGADEGLKVATVDDSMSFSQAFEAARAQAGAGGVFTWHGNIFNTYTADEWKAMSHDDKQLFAEQVKPQIDAANIDTEQLVAHVAPEDKPEDGVEAAQEPSVTVEVEDDEPLPDANLELASVQESQKQEGETTWSDITSNDDDVRIVGFRDVEIGRGRSVTMQEIEVNGQRVAVIDVDKDGTPDLAMSDLNHNQQMDEGEVLDLHTGEPLAFNNDEAPQDMPDVDTFTA